MGIFNLFGSKTQTIPGVGKLRYTDYEGQAMFVGIVKERRIGYRIELFFNVMDDVIMGDQIQYYHQIIDSLTEIKEKLRSEIQIDEADEEINLIRLLIAREDEAFDADLNCLAGESEVAITLSGMDIIEVRKFQ